MSNHWWQDAVDRNGVWQGLELTVADCSGRSLMEMVSGYQGRMALMVSGEALFWATELQDHSAIWLLYNQQHAAARTLIPAITSTDVEAAGRAAQPAGCWWSRYFARQLTTAGNLLSARRWLIRPLCPQPGISKVAGPAGWQFRAPPGNPRDGLNWQLDGQAFPELAQPTLVNFVEWWGTELLLARYSIDHQAGRLRWWRKKGQEGTLPPVLVRWFGGLSSYVILDGHYRLQAAIDEGIPPLFLVLSELQEMRIDPQPEHQARVMKSLALQQAKNSGFDSASCNDLLLNLFETHYRSSPTHSRAIPGYGQAWEAQVTDYLRHHRLEAWLQPVLQRVALGD